MLQKCSYLNVLKVFFEEPTEIHFIREISRKISLAPTSVKKYIQMLEKENLIYKKKSAPFNGYLANRNNERFIAYKQVYNLYSIYELKNRIIENIGPRAIILFGSYQKGEDIEISDIDLIVISKIKKEIDLKKIEKLLKRRIHLTLVKDLAKLNSSVQKNVKNGWVIYGKI